MNTNEQSNTNFCYINKKRYCAEKNCATCYLNEQAMSSQTQIMRDD